MTVRYDVNQVRSKYNGFAHVYDLYEGTVDWLFGIDRVRNKFLSKIEGPMLEVGAGTGRNLHLYRKQTDVTLTDISEGMLEVAKQRCRRMNPCKIRLLMADTHKLPFADDSFRTVISSQTMCTLTDPVEGLREMGRVCSPGGRIYLIEHGESSVGWIDRWIQRNEERSSRNLACHPRRDHVGMVEEAGLRVESVSRSHLGIFFRIVALPPA